MDVRKGCKKGYATPKLMVFGDIKALTMSGVGSVAEGGNQMVGCMASTAKRPCP